MPTPTVSARLLEPVLQLARHYRTDAGQSQFDQLLQTAGLSESEFTKPGSRFPSINYPKVLEQLIQLSNNPLISLSLGEATQPRMLGSVGFLMSTSDNLGQAYRSLIDYLPLLHDEAVLELEQHPEGTLLTLELNHYHPTVIDYLLACLINWPRWLTGRQVAVQKVELAHAQPEDPRPFQQFFAAETEFGASHNRLWLSSDYLSLPCLDANAEMHQLHREFADALLGQGSQQGALIAKTRNLIRQQLIDHQRSVSREQIAEHLGLSLRTLQRKLGVLDTSFQEIHDQTRRDLCLQMIQRGELSFGEIAYQLGFSNQSAFQKAFKRWMDQPPSEYRKQVRPQPLEPVAIPQQRSVDQSWLQGTDRSQQINLRLKQLPDLSRELLDWASLLENPFSLRDLSNATGSPIARLMIHLWPVEQAGLIETNPSDNTLYEFSHSSIRAQLSDSLIPATSQQMHQRYAEVMLKQHFEPDDQVQGLTLGQLLRLLNHLQQADSRSERINQISIEAADMARDQGNFEQAAQLLTIACQRSQVDITNYPLWLNCAEMHLKAGQPGSTIGTLETLNSIDLPANAQMQVALLRAGTYQHRGEEQLALKVLLDQLRQQQTPLPDGRTELLDQLLNQLTRIADQVGQGNLDRPLPPAQDIYELPMRLLERLSLLARQLGQPLLAACAIGRMAEMSLLHGQTRPTPYAFISYAWVCSWFCADWKLARCFSDRGLQLATEVELLSQSEAFNPSQFPAVSNASFSPVAARLVHCAQVQHWFQPLSSVNSLLQATSDQAAERGLWAKQSQCSLLQSQLGLFSRQPLSEQREMLQQRQQVLQQHQLPEQAKQLEQSTGLLIDLLQGNQPWPEQLDYQQGWRAIALAQASLLLNRQQAWSEICCWESRLENEMPGYFGLSEMLFCSALMRLIQGHQQQGLNPRRRLETEQLISRFELWARHCPDNFDCQRLLLQAEYARLNQQPAAAFFEQALQAAIQQGFSYYPALVQERYAELLLAQHQTSLARYCVESASRFYSGWQAHAKVKQLEQRLALLAE